MGHMNRANLEASPAVKVFEATVSSAAELPSHVDWRMLGVVTPVKDQGQCGSCWSFATAETVESHFALAVGGDLDTFSEQQVLDCTSNPQDCGGSGGCSGGIAQLGFEGIMAKGGLASEWTYPYQSYWGENFQCRQNNTRTPGVAKITGYVNIKTNDYLSLLEAVATKGPIAISVDASVWHDYETGVFTGCNVTTPIIDHAVQLVGYGTDAKYGDYWLVRNSWSPTAWGEEGYIRLPRSANPTCGVDTDPSQGDGCNGGPSEVKVCGACAILYDNCYPTVVKV
jgi:cathepsin L